MFTSGEAATAFDAAQPMIYHTEAALTRTKIALQKLRSQQSWKRVSSFITDTVTDATDAKQRPLPQVLRAKPPHTHTSRWLETSF
jgi:hypothetical protein